VAVSWNIYQKTGDPLALGLIGLAEAVPFTLVSLPAGHWVDRHAKKPFMVGAQGAQALYAGALFLLTFFPGAPLPFFYGLIALAGFGIGVESVAASAYAQILVPTASFPRAAAWNLIGFTAATLLGPLLAGGMLARLSARTVYGASFAFFLLAMTLAARLKPLPPSQPADAESAWVRVKEGLRFIRSEPLLLACMSLDMVAVLFGDCVALFPIFADLHRAGPLGFGILRASPALGAAILSGIQAARPFVIPSWGNLKRVVVGFGLTMIGFALSGTMAAAVSFLVLGGALDGVSVIIRQSLYQARTPDALRGRVTSVSGIFISTSNEIGAFESGLAARLMGPVPSVIFGGAVTLLSVGVFGWMFRRRLKEEKES